MAKAGFDVWLTNSRGNAFSRLHKTLDPDVNPEYWDFTFEEMGLYDTKATIEYVKKKTEKSKIAAVGTSQGADLYFYGLSKNHEWFKDNLSIFIAMCPVVNPGESSCPGFREILVKVEKMAGLFKYLGMTEIPLRNYTFRKMYGIYMALFPAYSTSSLKTISDKRMDLIDTVAFQRQHVNIPYGTSLKLVTYWKQIMDRGMIADFDYGEEENMKRYSTPKSPAIDLSNITDVPIALLVGKHDYLSEIKQSRQLKEMINPDVLKAYHEFEEHGHFTFIGGKDASHWDVVSKLVKEHSC
jgi:pimeloyl-ACP methyl ester carboxylesterase